MLDRLQVEQIMKNYLVSMDNEIKESYEKFIQADKANFVRNVHEFCESIEALLDYYAEPIFKSGRTYILKRVYASVNSEYSDAENEFIYKFKSQEIEAFGKQLRAAIHACFEERENDKEFYNQLIEQVIGRCIKLYKQSQLMTCKNNGIETIKLISDNDNSCSSCKTMSKFAHKVDTLLTDMDKFHSFCKLAIEIPPAKTVTANHLVPTTEMQFIDLPNEYRNKISSFVMNLQRNVPDLVTSKTIRCIENIVDTNEFVNLLTNKFGEKRMQEIKPTVDNQVMYFKTEDTVLISNKALNKFEYILALALLEDKLNLVDYYWWTNAYNKKQKTKYVGDKVALFSEPFVSYIAEQNALSYFVESAIYYVINPKLLKSIDADNYDRLKEFVFKGIEFLRG